MGELHLASDTMYSLILIQKHRLEQIWEDDQLIIHKTFLKLDLRPSAPNIQSSLPSLKGNPSHPIPQSAGQLFNEELDERGRGRGACPGGEKISKPDRFTPRGNNHLVCAYSILRLLHLARLEKGLARVAATARTRRPREGR